MKPILLATLLLLPAPAFADWNRIDDTKELKRYVVGKAFETSDKRAWFKVNSNGTLSGGFKKAKLTGKWTFKNGFFCSTDRMLGGKRQKSDCAVLRVKGRALESARSKGKGRVAKYRRQ